MQEERTDRALQQVVLVTLQAEGVALSFHLLSVGQKNNENILVHNQKKKRKCRGDLAVGHILEDAVQAGVGVNLPRRRRAEMNP